MVKVHEYRGKRRTLDPITKKWTTAMVVAYIEHGRGGANSEMSETTDALNSVAGKETGLPQSRIHTHLVALDALDQFPVGKELPDLYVNRTLTSLPNMRQQEGVGPRNIDGKPTFFKTSISRQQREDKDERMSNEALAKVRPDLFATMITSATVVENVQEAVQQPQTQAQNQAADLATV